MICAAPFVHTPAPLPAATPWPQAALTKLKTRVLLLGIISMGSDAALWSRVDLVCKAD